MRTFAPTSRFGPPTAVRRHGRRGPSRVCGLHSGGGRPEGNPRPRRRGTPPQRRRMGVDPEAQLRSRALGFRRAYPRQQRVRLLHPRAREQPIPAHRSAPLRATARSPLRERRRAGLREPAGDRQLEPAAAGARSARHGEPRSGTPARSLSGRRRSSLARLAPKHRQGAGSRRGGVRSPRLLPGKPRVRVAGFFSSSSPRHSVLRLYGSVNSDDSDLRPLSNFPL